MQKHIPLIGRILLSQVFIIYGLIKVFDFEHYWHVMELQGIPMAPLVAIIVVAIEVGGGIAILIGFQTRLFSAILAAYLIVLTIIEYPVWENFDHFDNFIRNLAILGGLFIEEYAGAGPDSIDESHLFDT